MGGGGDHRQKGVDSQREFAHRYARPACVGAFMPAMRAFARPPAGNSAVFAMLFAQSYRPVMVREPHQPFRPFWLLFWPQNLTGQSRLLNGGLPAFGALNSPNINGLRTCVSVAEYRQFKREGARSAAHDKCTDGTLLDLARSIRKVAVSHAERSKGASSCVSPFLPHFSPQPQPLPPVATRRANKRSLGRGPVRPVQPCSTAIWSPVPRSVPRVTCSIASKSAVTAKAFPVDAPRLTASRLLMKPSPWVRPMRGGFAFLDHLSPERAELPRARRPLSAPQGTAHV